MKRLMLLTPILLAGCATTPPEPIIRTVEVKVPVPTPCVPANVPAEPDYGDTDAALLAAPDGPARYQILAQGRQARIARSGVTEPLITACREAPTKP